MTRKKTTTKPSKRGATAKKATTTKKGHRPKGTKAKPRGRQAVSNPLANIGGTPKTTSSKKSDKPVIDLGDGDEALALHQLIIKKDQVKTLTSDVKELEAELIPTLDQRRLAFSLAKQTFIGSVNVHGKGEDEDGNEFDTGLVNFYIQNRYTGFDPEEASKDDDLQEAYDGEAQLRDDAVHGIIDALAEHDEMFDEDSGSYDPDVAYEEAHKLLKQRMDLSHNFALTEGALALNPDGSFQHPKVIDALMAISALESFPGQFIKKTVKMVPTEGFHERSNYDPQDQAMMAKLHELGLVKRSKPVIKPSTSAKTKTKPGKPSKRRTRKA